MYAVSGDYQIPSCHLANHKSRVLLPFQSALKNIPLTARVRSIICRMRFEIYRLSDMSRLSRVCSSLKFAQYFRFTAGGIFKLNTLSDYVFCHNAVAVSGLSAVRTFTNCSPSGDQGVLNRIVKEHCLSAVVKPLFKPSPRGLSKDSYCFVSCSAFTGNQ